MPVKNSLYKQLSSNLIDNGQQLKCGRYQSMIVHTISHCMFERHRRMDVTRVHRYATARVGEAGTLGLPVMPWTHITARRATVHAILVGGRVRACWDITRQSRRRLKKQEEKQSR